LQGGLVHRQGWMGNVGCVLRTLTLNAVRRTHPTTNAIKLSSCRVD